MLQALRGLRQRYIVAKHSGTESGKKLPQNVVDGLGAGLAASGTHDLADEEFEDTFVARFEFGQVVRIFVDDFAGYLLERAVVIDWREAFGGDDFRRAAS